MSSELSKTLAENLDFKAWLESLVPNEPDWYESEYSGDILFAFQAWSAGMAAARKGAGAGMVLGHGTTE